MKIISFVAELQGNKEVILNGRNVLDESVTHTFDLDEKVFQKLDVNQQWVLLCEIRKLGSRLSHAYDDARVVRGELTYGDITRIRSGAGGVEGSNLGRLIGGNEG